MTTFWSLMMASARHQFSQCDDRCWAERGCSGAVGSAAAESAVRLTTSPPTCLRPRSPDLRSTNSTLCTSLPLPHDHFLFPPLTPSTQPHFPSPSPLSPPCLPHLVSLFHRSFSPSLLLSVSEFSSQSRSLRLLLLLLCSGAPAVSQPERKWRERRKKENRAGQCIASFKHQANTHCLAP